MLTTSKTHTALSLPSETRIHSFNLSVCELSVSIQVCVFGLIIFGNNHLPILADLGHHLLTETCHAVQEPVPVLVYHDIGAKDHCLNCRRLMRESKGRR